MDPLEGDVKFSDEYLGNLDIDKPESIVLLLGYLRGDLFTNHPIETKSYLDELKKGIADLKRIIDQNEKLGHAQLNEILLSLNRNRISKGFFYFFFVPQRHWPRDLDVEAVPVCYTISRKELRNGVIKFRGLALFKYGNFRFAHKLLRELSLREIIRELGDLTTDPETLEQWYQSRHPKMVDIKRIDREHTWLVGYLSQQDLKIDSGLLAVVDKARRGKDFERSKDLQQRLKLLNIKPRDLDRLMKELKDQGVLGKWKTKYPQLRKKVEQLEDKRQWVLAQATKNTDIYLTWDYMDVYVATSMRTPWEFEAVWGFMDRLFYSGELKNMGLRFFDPTQSFALERLNKGLVESLMLKRAKVTIYMVQEIDTLGKDSELAATLAQGKPVIAYVPSISDLEKYSQDLADRPLEYFYKRILGLLFEGIQKSQKAQSMLNGKFGRKLNELERSFVCNLLNYFSRWHFRTDDSDELEFKKDPKVCFSDMCWYLSVLEQCFYDKRADVLRGNHPLAMQVNLSTGVANGIMVVRSEDDCRMLVKGILTNRANYRIEYCDWLCLRESEEHPLYIHELREYYATLLKETISGCPYRIVTGHEKITNSFWNFYLRSGGGNE